MSAGDRAPIRVLIADDHGLMRAGLRTLLGEEPDMEVVGEAPDGADALRLGSQLQPDVVLADVSMPPPDGIELARRLRREVPSARTLIVSMHDDGHLVQDALDAGAAGYLVKRAVVSDLVLAIRTVAAGEVYVHKEAEDQRQTASQSLAEEREAPAETSGSADLNASDRLMLELLAHGATTSRLAEKLGISVGEADDRRASLMRRLGLRGRVDVVKYVRSHYPTGVADG